MKVLFYILIFCTSTLLTGCFELIKEVSLKRDGSGKIEVIVNFSQSKTSIDVLLLLDEINGHNIPSLDEIDEKCSSLTDSIKSAPGLTNVNGIFNRDDYIFEFSCEFDKVERLNECIYEFWKKKDQSEAKRENYYAFNKNNFKQNFSARVAKLYLDMKPIDREIFIGAEYVSIHRFEDQVVSQNNKRSIIASSGNVVFMREPMLQLILNPKFFNNIIKLKK